MTSTENLIKIKKSKAKKKLKDKKPKINFSAKKHKKCFRGKKLRCRRSPCQGERARRGE